MVAGLAGDALSVICGRFNDGRDKRGFATLSWRRRRGRITRDPENALDTTARRRISVRIADHSPAISVDAEDRYLRFDTNKRPLCCGKRGPGYRNSQFKAFGASADFDLFACFLPGLNLLAAPHLRSQESGYCHRYRTNSVVPSTELPALGVLFRISHIRIGPTPSTRIPLYQQELHQQHVLRLPGLKQTCTR